MYIYLCTYSYVCVYVFLYVCYMTICSQYIKCQKINAIQNRIFDKKYISRPISSYTNSFPPKLIYPTKCKRRCFTHSILAESFINNEAGFTLTPYLLSDTLPGSLCTVKPQESRVSFTPYFLFNVLFDKRAGFNSPNLCHTPTLISPCLCWSSCQVTPLGQVSDRLIDKQRGRQADKQTTDRQSELYL